ncbi:hypothetical protein MTR_3g009380 [Medicago truncatula]|uniref:Uncharacterized protein n=1 Tax=Medicago truncatula TaxID=3880 RepID=A0A072V428_MEDTR|nr:hypothetical protein MTR_3g009380 [Medicago truncatula]
MCVMLDERKAQLKLMIHSLEKGHADNNDDLDEGEKDEDVEGANEDEEEGDAADKDRKMRTKKKIHHYIILTKLQHFNDYTILTKKQRFKCGGV